MHVRQQHTEKNRRIAGLAPDVFSVLVMILSLASVYYSQSANSAVLSGTVMDVGNSVIQGAVVTATNKSMKYEATTSQFGEYSMQLPPDTYSIKVEAPSKGWAISHRSEIRLVSSKPKILNFIVYAKLALLAPYSPLPSTTLDDSAIVEFSYDVIPKLSLVGVSDGMIRYGGKTVSKSVIDYRGISIQDTKEFRAGVTFTYDFFSVTADEIRFCLKTKEFIASGGVTIEEDGVKALFPGTLKITIQSGIATYQQLK